MFQSFEQFTLARKEDPDPLFLFTATILLPLVISRRPDDIAFAFSGLEGIH